MQVHKAEATDDSSDNEDTQPIVRHKKVNTCNRIFNSLDKTVGPNNYNKFVTPDTNENYKCVIVKGTKREASEHLTWTNQRSSVPGRQSVENILKTKEGMISDASKDADTPIKS